jgi:hypothetical protein
MIALTHTQVRLQFMKITFTLTDVDFARLQNVVVKRFRAQTGVLSWPFFLRVLVWMCVGFAGAAYARIMSDHPEMSGSLGTVAVLLVIALLALVALPHMTEASLRKRMVVPNGVFLSPQTVYFSETAAHISSVFGTREMPWAALLARDEDAANYYLFIDATQAFIFPRAAVAPFAAEFERYTAHLKSAA